MFSKNYMRSPTFWIISSFLIFMGLWVISVINTLDCRCWPHKKWGTAFGVAGFYLFSLSLLFSSRWKALEKEFGGLDQIYKIHKYLGIWAGCLILIHPWLEALKWFPQKMNKFLLFTFPIHGRESMNFGSYSYWLMIFILGITLLKLLPYDKWKIMHKFMTFVFILASLHVILSEKKVGSDLTYALLYIPMGIGFWSIAYKQIYLDFFAKRPVLAVSNVKKLDEKVVEVALTASEKPLQFYPGQYGFFSFRGQSLSHESHPFTLIETEDPMKSVILVKKRGDFTNDFYEHVTNGCTTYFEGPYGRLDYREGNRSQIWIAGGIGVVLFLAWIRAISKNPETLPDVDFYYCVHNREDAVFFDEFFDFSKKYATFRFFLCCTEENTRLDFEKLCSHSKDLISKQVFMCGPLKLTKSFEAMFRKSGLEKRNIRYENFEFF